MVVTDEDYGAENRLDSQPAKIAYTTNETVGTNSDHMQRIELFKPMVNSVRNKDD